MRPVDLSTAPAPECWERERFDELAAHTLACVGVTLPSTADPALDRRLDHARRRLEALITDDATGADAATWACGLLLRIDGLQRRRTELRLREVAEFDAFRSLAERLERMPLEDLLDSGASAVCGAMGFARALFSSVSSSMWTPRTVHLEPSSEQEAAAVRTFVTDAAWRLEWAPLESEVVRRRSATLVECAQESHRTFRPLMDVTRSRSYVVAPVRARRRVIGLLHGDRWDDGVDRADLERLEAYAQSFGAAVERAVLRKRVRVLADQAAEALRAAAEQLAEHDGDAALLTDPGPRRRAESTGVPFPAPGPVDPVASARLAQLSPREFDVLAEMSHGLRNAEIAGRLCLTEGTVKSHVANILRKLQVHSRAAATALLTRYEAGRPDLAAR